MRGAVDRVRPKMITVVAIMAGLLPIMWSTGTGFEVMQRIAVPMIGEMVSSTLLTLVVKVLLVLGGRQQVVAAKRLVGIRDKLAETLQQVDALIVEDCSS